MGKTLLIEEGLFETRAALMQGEHLVEIQIERPDNLSRVGDFFNGRVAKLLPDMNIAFVDIGPAGDGFLQLDDIPTKATSINSAVHEGEKLLVQVIKDAKDDKSLQLGCRFALHGSNLIFRPSGKGITLPKGIKAPSERDRLRNLFESPAEDFGLTVRTSAQHASDAELTMEFDVLVKDWVDIQGAWKAATKPGPLGPEKTPLNTILKSLATTNMEVIVNSAAALNATKDYFASRMPGTQPGISLWNQQTPLFEEKNVEAELEMALQKHVPLPSRGNITIEPTEAAIVIDVNSASQTQAVGTRSAALATNLEAALEICRQLRLRNLSGIIIIDFIQMNGKGEVEQLTKALKDTLDQDPVQTRLIGMTELGLMQITRKRARPALRDILLQPCPTCECGGYVKNEGTILSEVLRALQNEARFSHLAKLKVEAGEALATRLQNNQTLLETEIARPIVISTNARFSDFDYKIG